MKKNLLILSFLLMFAGVALAVWPPQIRYRFRPIQSPCWNYVIHYPVTGGSDYYTNNESYTYTFQGGDQLWVQLNQNCCTANACQIGWQWTEICYDPQDPPAQQTWHLNSTISAMSVDPNTYGEMFNVVNGAYTSQQDVDTCPHQP